MARGWEWQAQSPTQLGSGDVHMAFSNVTYGVAREAMNFWGAHPQTQLAILKELEESEAWLEVDGISARRPFKYQKMRTGGKEGPPIWNLVIATAGSQWLSGRTTSSSPRAPGRIWWPSGWT